ncbi:unnamed protein product, partial [Ectocarpus sp. 8 AP-2014]
PGTPLGSTRQDVSIAELCRGPLSHSNGRLSFATMSSTNLGQIFHVRVFSRIEACKRDDDDGVPLAPQNSRRSRKPPAKGTCCCYIRRRTKPHTAGTRLHPRYVSSPVQGAAIDCPNRCQSQQTNPHESERREVRPHRSTQHLARRLPTPFPANQNSRTTKSSIDQIYP